MNRFKAAPIFVLAALVFLSGCPVPTLPPAVPGLDAPVLSAAALTNDNTPTWTWTGVDGAAGYRVQRNSQAGAWTELPASQLSWTPSGPLSNGSHTLYLQVANPAGSWSVSSSRTLTVDTFPPAKPVLEAATPTNDATPSWSWAQPADTAEYRFQLDAQLSDGWSALPAGTVSWTPASPLPDGSHTLYLGARDEAGNWSVTGSKAVTVDSQILGAPTVSAASPVQGRTATWTWTAVSGVTAYRCSLDTEAGTWTELGAGTLSRTETGLSAGLHTLYVQAGNAANQWSASGSSVVSVEPVADTRLRLMAANLSSGNLQSYDPGHGIRIMQGVDPDVVMVQEFNYLSNSAADLQAMADAVMEGHGYYWREADAQIPNGIISRYPILAAGEWDDLSVTNRDFAWARIDIPGPVDLWAVSVHILTSGATVRNTEAGDLVDYIAANVPAGAYLTVAGDFNTDSRAEACYATLSPTVVTGGSYPASPDGIQGTNASRSKPYDGVYVDSDLSAFSVAVTIGSASYANGLVVDTRTYTPVADLAPALSSDSGATNMQHMGVIRDFVIPGD